MDVITQFLANAFAFAEDPKNERWAMTQNNLGIALREQGVRTVGDLGKALLRGAIEAFTAAADVYRDAGITSYLAMVERNLAGTKTLLAERAKG